MSWTFIIIIGVLVFIAYQLVQLNRGKEYELGLKIAEKNEEKIKELFPHLYSIADEDLKEEIRGFVVKNAQKNMAEDDSSFDKRTDPAYYPGYYWYLDPYKIMNGKIDAETDLQRKKRMRNIKESTSKELEQWHNRLEKMADQGRISEWEMDFIFWNLLEPINDQFPERHFKLDDYFDSKFGRLQLPKD